MKKLKVLVADDNEGIKFLIGLILESHQVIMATNGQEGLEIFGKNPNFDLLITDRNMPGMCGEELIKRVKDLNPDIKAILITSDPKIEIVEMVAKAAGADCVLNKDFALRDENLEETIKYLFFK